MILSVCIGIGNLFCFRQQFPLSVAAIILPEYDLHIGDTGFAVADLMISVCIVPDNTGDRYMRILLHNAAVISGDICRLYNVIVHAANLTAIRCISAECFRQDQECIRLLQIQCAGDQIAVLVAVSSRMIFRCSISFRHFTKLHLIPH